VENGCFSCHNNGDGARALLAARKAGYSEAAAALASTTAWLLAPREWGAARSSEGSSDKKLARIQFAAALSDAVTTGAVAEDAGKRALASAAGELAALQESDGSWRVEGDTSLGSPVTYGAPLATYMAKRTLERAGGYAERISRADRWLASAPVTSALDASAVVLALPDRKQALATLERAQNADGGWGPYPKTPAEPFDTAIALLALRKAVPESKAIARGRAWLISAQLSDGGWPGTTRPAGAQSYAQHISTCGWATQALLATK
jgi:hypothetical protein